MREPITIDGVCEDLDAKTDAKAASRPSLRLLAGRLNAAIPSWVKQSVGAAAASGLLWAACSWLASLGPDPAPVSIYKPTQRDAAIAEAMKPENYYIGAIAEWEKAAADPLRQQTKRRHQPSAQHRRP